MGEDLLRFLRSRLPQESDAEDLAQEVYLRLLRVKDRDRIENQRAYVLRVAANIANEWRLLARVCWVSPGLRTRRGALPC